MADLYRQGKTLEEIGYLYDLTRERVRQLLKGIGMTREEGGSAIRSLLNVRDRPRKRNPEHVFLKCLDCSKALATELNEGMPIYSKGSLSAAYISQRWNAKYRGILWEFTFPEWVSVWRESGHWDGRGVGSGYCMSRICDTGPYSAENVVIQTGRESGREYQLLKKLRKAKP